MKEKPEEKLEISKRFNNSFAKKIIFDRPILKLICLVVLNFLLINTVSYLPKFFAMRIIFDITKLLIAVYFIIAVIYIAKNRIEYLMNPSHLGSLIMAYAVLVIIVILIFSTVLSIVEITKTGYITYNFCTDAFNAEEIETDPLLSHNYFYFTAVTFFTVGYGDICPMGTAKIFTVLIALAGHVISVILVALIINNYLRKKKK